MAGRGVRRWRLPREQRGLEDAAELARAAGCPARLAMLDHLRRRPSATVGELRAAIGVSQPTTSRHVSDLRRAGLITTRRRGQRVDCTLTATGAYLFDALTVAVEGVFE